MTGNCTFCGKTGLVRVRKGENNCPEDMAVCEMHWKILKNPSTALPFLKGVTMAEIRFRSQDKENDLKTAEIMFESISKWRPKPERS